MGDVFVYRIDTEDGLRDVVSLMDHDWLSAHGEMPSEAILGAFPRPPGSGDDISPETFQENPDFTRFLQEVIAQHIGGVGFLVEAAAGQDGAQLYLVDGRAQRPADGEPALHDVIGMVAVRSGRLVPSSYQPNPAHRLFTDDGFLDLPPDLEAVLRREIEAVTRPAT